MKRALSFIAGVAIIAAVVHVAFVWALPRVIMSRAMSVIAGRVEANRFVEPKLATAKARGIVRPSPDLAYSICVLDLSKGPVRVQVPLTAPYTSVALYAPTTDNYFVRNDRQADGKPLDLVVLPKGTTALAGLPAGATAIEAPADKGLVLVRRVVENNEAFPALDEIRKQAICAPIKG